MGSQQKCLRDCSQHCTCSYNQLFNISLQLHGWASERVETCSYCSISEVKWAPSLYCMYLSTDITVANTKQSAGQERHIHSLAIFEVLVFKWPNVEYPIGFLKGTTGTLVPAVNDWHTHLDNGLNVCVEFFDLKKCVWYSVPRIALLKKLAALNLNPCLYRWITDYLYQRTLGVAIWITSDLSWTKQRL